MNFKKKLVYTPFVALFLSITFLSLSQNLQCQPTPPIVFNNYISDNFNNNKQTVEVAAASSAKAQNETIVENKITTDIKIFLKELYKQAVTKGFDTKDEIVVFCKNNQYKILISAASAAYLYLLYSVQKCRLLIDDENAWCCWKMNVKTSELIEISDQIICEKLIKAIQAKYLINQENLDFFDPFTEFVKDIKKELEVFKFYIKLHKIFDRLHLKKLFFINDDLYSTVEDKFERVYFLYKNFISWHTERNMQKI